MDNLEIILKRIDKAIENIEEDTIMLYRYDEVIEVLEELKSKIVNENFSS
jgi:hypothetical protein